MAIGDTVQAGLMRVDTTPLLQAQIRSSEQMGNAIAGLGRDIGSGIQKFMQNKKEGEAADMQIGALLQNMSPERQQEIQSGEGELGKSLSKFMSGELGNSKKKALLGSLMTINTADQLNREEAMAAERFKQQKEINDLNRLIAQGKIDDRLSNNALNESLAKFSMQPVQTPTPEFSALQQEYRPEQIPGTPEFIAMEESEPMGARPSIIAKTITEQPDFKRFEKQDSPAVAQLPDSFKPQGRRIQEAVESGELSNQAGMMAINKIYGQAIAQQKDAPTINEQIALDKRREELEERKELKASEKRQRESLLNETNDILEIIKKGKDVTGQVEGLDFVRALKKSVGYGKEDEKLRRKLERYANKFTLENVSKLKGPLSEKELAFIQQSSPKITDEPEVWVDFLTSLEEQLNTENQGETPQVDPSAPASQSLLDEIERKRQLRSKRAGL